MKNISLPLIIGAVMCVASILFGVNTINSGGTVKGILWMVAALCWASFVRNIFRKTTSKIIDKIINKEIFIIKILKEIKKGLSH